MEIGAVKESMKGKKIILTGLLKKSIVLGFGAYKGILEKDGDSIIVFVKKYNWPNFLPAAKDLLKQGASLTIRGYVETYHDKVTQKTVMEIIPDGRDGCVVPAGEGSTLEAVVTPGIENDASSVVTPGSGGN